MFSFLDIIGHLGLIIAALCVIGIVLVLIYVPTPVKHYAVLGLILLAAASTIYNQGYANATTEWRAKYDAMVDKTNADNQAALIAAQKAEQDRAAAQVAVLKQQLQQLDVEKQASDQETQRLQQLIDSAPKSADAPADSLILDVIHGGSK